jgi:hypothetical protein
MLFVAGTKGKTPNSILAKAQPSPKTAKVQESDTCSYPPGRDEVPN